MSVKKMTAYEILQKSREKGRPTTRAYIKNLLDNFIELHGDRRFADDKAVIAGIGQLGNMPITLIAIEKGGETLSEKIACNFGSAHPEGYRKAVRLMKQAEKFKRPVLCLVDTAGAYCGIGAEERGQAEAIASSILEMIRLKTQTLSIIIGEGGSGGALALCCSDEVWMTETSMYSVISPEGCASILWKDNNKVAEAAENLKITAQDLYDIRVIDKIIAEENFAANYFKKLKREIINFFKEKKKIDMHKLIEDRYTRFRKF